MLRNATLVWFGALVVLGACAFKGNGLATDGGPSDTVDGTVDAEPQPSVGFEQPASSADEITVDLLIPVVLSRPSNETVTVAYSGTGGSATRNTDYLLTDGILTFAPGETRKFVPVMIVADADEENPETIDLGLASPTGALLGAATHTITIAADILPRVQFTTATSDAGESMPSTIEVTLTLAAATDLTVTLSIGGTATPGFDHTTLDGTVITFPAGTTSQLIQLGVIDDGLDEDDETVTLDLKAPSAGMVLGALASTTHTIDDDDPQPTVSFRVATSSSLEGSGFGVIVDLSAVSGRAVTIPFSLSGTAVNSVDYTLLTGSPLVIPAGMTTAVISFAGFDDTTDEPDETIGIDLGQPINGGLGAITSRVHTIVDNDATPTVSFRASTYAVTEQNTVINFALDLSNPSSATITVPFTIDPSSTATNLSDYSIATSSPVTIPAGSTSGTLQVVIRDDLTMESSETILMMLGTPTNATLGTFPNRTITIVDND